LKRSHLPWLLGALGWGLALALSAAFGRPWKAGSPGGVAACATTAMLVGFGLAPPVRRFLVRLPGAHRAVLFAVIAALVFGHTFGSYRAELPFLHHLALLALLVDPSSRRSARGAGAGVRATESLSPSSLPSPP